MRDSRGRRTCARPSRIGSSCRCRSNLSIQAWPCCSASWPSCTCLNPPYTSARMQVQRSSVEEGRGKGTHAWQADAEITAPRPFFDPDEGPAAEDSAEGSAGMFQQ